MGLVVINIDFDCFYRERVNKRRLKEVITEYTLMWRGLLGTEYAAQTTK